MEKETRKYLCSYFHDDMWWSVEITAYDREDAEARVKKLGYLRLDGELMATVPAKCGFLVRFVVWVKNLLTGK